MSISIESMRNCVFVLLFLVLALVYDRYRVGIARRMIELWANQKGYHVTILKRGFYYNEPPDLMRSSSQPVFRISAEDKERNVRTGWIRCGHWFFGLLRDQVKVYWDERSMAEKATVRTVKTGMWDHDLDG